MLKNYEPLPRVAAVQSYGRHACGVVYEDGNIIACCHHRHAHADSARRCSEEMLAALNGLSFVDFWLHAWIGHPLAALLSTFGFRDVARRLHYCSLPSAVRSTSRIEEIPYKHGLLLSDLFVVPTCLTLRTFGMFRWAYSLERLAGLDRVADAAKRRGIGAIRLPTLVRITFRCTACEATASIDVPWQEHHALPDGWLSRDIEATPQLPRRTSHIFACGEGCAAALDEVFPPPQTPKWFPFS